MMTKGGGQSAWASAIRKRPCYYCVAPPPFTVDHKIPASAGGGTTPDNCVPACMRCQNLKCTMSYDEFVPKIRRFVRALRTLRRR